MKTLKTLVSTFLIACFAATLAGVNNPDPRKMAAKPTTGTATNEGVTVLL